MMNNNSARRLVIHAFLGSIIDPDGTITVEDRFVVDNNKGLLGSTAQVYPLEDS